MAQRVGLSGLICIMKEEIRGIFACLLFPLIRPVCGFISKQKSMTWSENEALLQGFGKLDALQIESYWAPLLLCSDYVPPSAI